MPLGEAAPAPLFAFRSAEGTLIGLGQAAALPGGPAATLAARLDTFFRSAGPDAILAGAMPFDRAAKDDLRQAARVASALPPQPAPARSVRWSLRHEPDAAGYADAVRRALDILAAEAALSAPPGDALTKIVLSRSLLATADAPIDPVALLHRLAADPSVTTFLVPLPDGQAGPRQLAGATPELLLSKRADRVASHPLAGSARRHREPARDAAAAEALLRSGKDGREHAIAAEFVLDTLAPWCRTLARPQGVQLRGTASLWHLGTRIEGRLKDPGLSAALLASILHPTPAVCGLPRDRAAALIDRLEPRDRGFYGGAIGWCDGRGDGTWHVAIRCAELSGRQARLHAGAGIVPGSEPWKEVDETAAKYGAMLAALGIDLPEDRAGTAGPPGPP
ncbi:isochorismate synthase [Roseicella frigidaeris]|uniref:isochorismate synthase n=1 Tax=Roseicella frigidaeris TaxID=2230885 RepID=A0A327M9I7_9PROT|nr:isochorismate synthase [Roseicella frigidaeris]RAI59065.1 isochorismate synthase [Roseicella frigidaeris]